MSLLTSLISSWELDEASGDAVDSHGSNDLTDYNSTGSGTGLVHANARDFEIGSQNYFSGSGSGLSPGDTDFTIQAWVKLESEVSDYSTIVSKWLAGNHEYFLGYDPSSNRFTWSVSADGSTQSTVLADFPHFVVGYWYLVTAWNNSTTNEIGIHVNNSQAYTTSHSGGAYAGSAPFAVGFDSSNPSATTNNYFDGLIGPVRFWNRLLTQAEMLGTTNYRRGLTYAELSAFTPPSTPDPEGFIASPLYCYTDDPPSTPCDHGDEVQWWWHTDFVQRFTQATSADRPTFNTHSGAYNSVDFDVAATQSMTGALNVTGYSENYLIMQLVQLPGDNGGYATWVSGADHPDSFYPYTGDGIIYEAFGTTVRRAVTPSMSFNRQHRTYEVAASASGWEMFLDGISQHYTGTNTLPTLSTSPSLGTAGGNYWSGQIVAFDVRTAIPTGGDLTTLRSQYAALSVVTRPPEVGIVTALDLSRMLADGLLWTTTGRTVLADVGDPVGSFDCPVTALSYNYVGSIPPTLEIDRGKYYLDCNAHDAYYETAPMPSFTSMVHTLGAMVKTGTLADYQVIMTGYAAGTFRMCTQLSGTGPWGTYGDSGNQPATATLTPDTEYSLVMGGSGGTSGAFVIDRVYDGPYTSSSGGVYDSLALFGEPGYGGREMRNRVYGLLIYDVAITDQGVANDFYGWLEYLKPTGSAVLANLFRRMPGQFLIRAGCRQLRA